MLAVWLPNWPVQRLVSIRPELKSQAVILHNAAQRGREVTMCSHQARKLGVREGMPVAEATSLIRDRQRTRRDRGMPLYLQPHDPQADRRALEKLAQRCHQYSPSVGLEDCEWPETLLLDVTGVASLFGSERALVEQIVRDLQRRGFTAHPALADTIGAAWAMAHYGCRNPDTMGASIVNHRDHPTAIAALPLVALRLPDVMVETLSRLGIERVGELLSIARVELEARFDSVLLRRLDQALGTATEAIRCVRPPQEFSAEWLFQSPVEEREVIDQVIEQLVDQLSQRLSERSAGALRMTLRLDCHPAPSADLEVGLFHATANSRHLWELIHLKMERLRLLGPVSGVHARVAEHAPLKWRQQELFAERRRQNDSPQVASLVERLTSRLGRKSVTRCVLARDAQPEMGYRAEPLIDRSIKEPKSRGMGTSSCPLDRPLHLLKRPARIAVIAVALEGPPIRFRYGACDHDVARHWGPERIETGWWRCRGVQRDYYRVETKTGHRFWLFREIREDNWFLQGIFD